MKKILSIFLMILLIITKAASITLSAIEDSYSQGHGKLSDNIEHIKNDVISDDLETVVMLKKSSNRSIESHAIKRETIFNRLDDKSILKDDDDELILIYKVQYTFEEKAKTKSSIVTGYRIDSEYYSYNNITINLLVRLDYNKDLGYQHQSGARPLKITKSTYSFDAGSAYYNNRLGVKEIQKNVKQFGPPYPYGSYLAEDYSDTKTYPLWTFSDFIEVYHSPLNYTLMDDNISAGYVYSTGYFDIVNYVIAPPFNSWTVGTINRSITYGAPAPTMV